MEDDYPVKAAAEHNELSFQARSVNGYPYKLMDGDWVPDEDARKFQLKKEANGQKRKDDLVSACRSRILTAEEMAEIEYEGIELFLRYDGGMSQSYKEEELERKLNDLLLRQFRLRRVAEQAEQNERK